MKQGLIFLLIITALHARAHTVDEYVQASYIILTDSRILLEIDLTPGYQIGAEAVKLIDSNGDQRITEAEALGYVSELVSFLRLETGGSRLPLELLGFEYPSYQSFVEGRHGIKLHLGAPVPEYEAGNYKLLYRNNYEPAGFTSSYLVNGFVQTDAAGMIDISAQARDYYQRSLMLEYAITSNTPRSSQ